MLGAVNSYFSPLGYSPPADCHRAYHFRSNAERTGAPRSLQLQAPRPVSVSRPSDEPNLLTNRGMENNIKNLE